MGSCRRVCCVRRPLRVLIPAACLAVLLIVNRLFSICVRVRVVLCVSRLGRDVSQGGLGGCLQIVFFRHCGLGPRWRVSLYRRC